MSVSVESAVKQAKAKDRVKRKNAKVRETLRKLRAEARGAQQMVKIKV